MLQSLFDNDELSPRIRNLAAIKLASQKVDTAPFSEIQTLLRPVIDADDSWTPIAKEYLALSNNTRKYNTLLNFNLYNFLPTNRRIIEPINQRNNKNFTNQNIYEMNSNMKNNINQRLTNIKNAYLIPQNISQNNFGGIKYPNYTEPINMI